MKNIRFYVEVGGDSPFTKRDTIKTMRAYTLHANCIALLLGDEHRCGNGEQEALSATFYHQNSDVSLGAVPWHYLHKQCKRVSAEVARKLHPRLFERLDEHE